MKAPFYGASVLNNNNILLKINFDYCNNIDIFVYNMTKKQENVIINRCNDILSLTNDNVYNYSYSIIPTTQYVLVRLFNEDMSYKDIRLVNFQLDLNDNDWRDYMLGIYYITQKLNTKNVLRRKAS